MYPLEFLFGTFDSFETDVHQLEDGSWEASAMGRSARHADREQALNDLNADILTAMERGELVPENGN